MEIADGSLLLRQTYAFSDFHFVDDARWGDNTLPVVPEHQYRAELTWRHPSGLFVTPSVEWRISDVWVDYANTLKAPSYALLGVNTGFKLGSGATVYLDARNLTDERYLVTGQAQFAGGQAYGTYSRPREWYARLNVNF